MSSPYRFHTQYRVQLCIWLVTKVTAGNILSTVCRGFDKMKEKGSETKGRGQEKEGQMNEDGK